MLPGPSVVNIALVPAAIDGKRFLYASLEAGMVGCDLCETALYTVLHMCMYQPPAASVGMCAPKMAGHPKQEKPVVMLQGGTKI
jgi:hypothetical protein